MCYLIIVNNKTHFERRVVMTVAKNCMICGKEGRLEISPKIYKQYERYLSGVGYIQDIELPAEQRESS